MKWILSLLVIAALLGGLWYLTDADPATPAALPEAGTPDPGAKSGGSAAELVGSQGGSERATAGDSPKPLMGPDSATDAGQPGAMPNRGITIQPVGNVLTSTKAGIRVWLLDRSQRPGIEWQSLKRESDEWRDYVMEHGVEQSTGESGVTTFPMVESFAVYCEGPGSVGREEWIGPLFKPLRVNMQAVVELRVRVTDSEGRPLPAVPVLLFPEGVASNHAQVSRPTMGDGLANFSNVTTQFQRLEGITAISVRLGVATSQPVSARLDALNLPREIVELQLPPCAPVTVRAVDAKGQRIRQNMKIEVGHFGTDPNTGKRRFTTLETRTTRDGEVRLKYVGVGSPLPLRFSGVADLTDLETVEQGPPVADETHILEVPWTSALPVVVGQAVDDRGRVLAQRRGRVQLDLGRRRLTGPPVMTDADGRFRFSLEQPFEAGSQRLAVLALTGAGAKPPAEATLDLSYDLPAGETNIGTLTFTGLPLLASGFVTDGSGRALAGAQVTVEISSRGGSGEGEWKPLPGSYASTDDQGAFTLYGRDPRSPLRLVAGRSGYFSGASVFSAGAEGLNIALEAGGPTTGVGEKDGGYASPVKAGGGR